MKDRLVAREIVGGVDRAIGALLTVMVMLASLAAALWLSEVFPDMPIQFAIPIFFIVFICPGVAFGLVWMKMRRKKVVVTPFLQVDEATPISKEQQEVLDRVEGAQQLQGLIVGGGLVTDLAQSALLAAAKKGTHSRFTLCQEGLVWYRGSSANFIPWRRIGSVSADGKNKQFELTLRGVAGKLNLITPNKYDDVKNVLSAHTVVGERD